MVDDDLSVIDWNALIDLAKQNGVSQMLYTSVKTLGLTPPADIVDRLRSIHLSGVVDGMKRHHHFNKILDVLTSAGIVVIPIKGIWLSEAVYPNIAIRGMADIDLWIQREDLECAIAAMETIGYKMVISNVNRPQELQEALLGETLFIKNGVSPVELHWRIFRGEWLRHIAGIDEQIIRDRTLPLKGQMVRHLQVEDAFIHVAIHLVVNHQMSVSALRAMLDLHMMSKRLNIDWYLVAERAKNWSLATPVWLACDTMQSLFGEDRNLSARLLGLRPSVLRRLLLRMFVSAEQVARGLHIEKGIKKIVFQLLLIDRPMGALILAKQALWPDRNWLTLRYGLKKNSSWRNYVQHLLHIFFVIRDRKF